MKTLQKSTGLRRALGLGLLGLMLSVPAGQANADLVVEDINPSDSFFITSFDLDNPSENSMTLYETLSETSTGTYAAPYGNDYRIVGSSGSTYFDKVIDFTNGTGPVTWTFVITNNTGHFWTDYHFEFWNVEQDIHTGEWVGVSKVSGVSLIGATSDSFGNFHFADTLEGSDIDGNLGSVLTFVPGGVKIGQASGTTSTYTMTGDLGLLADASGNGTIGLRQVATIVPEPGTLSLIGVGLAGLLGYRRKMARA